MKNRTESTRTPRYPLAAIVLTLLAVSFASAGLAAEDASVDLSGEWQFRLDADDAGIQQRWFAADLPHLIRLPGSLQSQGYGNDPAVDTQWTGDIIDRSWFEDPQYAKYREDGNVKVTFWLQPDKHYVGPAWYQRTDRRARRLCRPPRRACTWSVLTGRPRSGWTTASAAAGTACPRRTSLT